METLAKNPNPNRNECDSCRQEDNENAKTLNCDNELCRNHIDE